MLAGVICSKNDRRTARAVRSLAGQVDLLVVVDSSESRAEAESLAAVAERAREGDGPLEVSFRWRPDLNLAQAKNLAVSELLERKDVEHIAFLDADETVARDWRQRVDEALGEGWDILVGSREPTEAGRLADYHRAMEAQHRADFRDPHTFRYLPQDNTVFRTAVFREIGLFDERFVNAGEDLDLGHRALQAGFRVGFAPHVVAYHDASGRQSLPSVLRRRFEHLVGGAMFALKHGRVGDAFQRPPSVWHPVQLLDLPLKTVALAVATWRLQDGRGDTG